MSYTVSSKAMNILGVICPVSYLKGNLPTGGDCWTPYEYLATEFDTEVQAKLWIIRHLFNPFRFKVRLKKSI